MDSDGRKRRVAIRRLERLGQEIDQLCYRGHSNVVPKGNRAERANEIRQEAMVCLLHVGEEVRPIYDELRESDCDPETIAELIRLAREVLDSASIQDTLDDLKEDLQGFRRRCSRILGRLGGLQEEGMWFKQRESIQTRFRVTVAPPIRDYLRTDLDLKERFEKCFLLSRVFVDGSDLSSPLEPRPFKAVDEGILEVVEILEEAQTREQRSRATDETVLSPPFEAATRTPAQGTETGDPSRGSFTGSDQSGVPVRSNPLADESQMDAESESDGDPNPITPQVAPPTPQENGSPRPAGTQEPSLEERQPDAESESEPEPVSAEGQQPEEPSKAGAEPTKHKPLSEGEIRRLPERVTVKQAVRALDRTQRNIRDRIRRGTPPSQGKGTRKRIPRQAIWKELGIIPTPPTSSDG